MPMLHIPRSFFVRGTLNCTSSVPASVQIKDGSKTLATFETPFQTELPVGQYTLLASNPEYASLSQNVIIYPEQETVTHLTLFRAQGKIRVVGNFTGIKITVT